MKTWAKYSIGTASVLSVVALASAVGVGIAATPQAEVGTGYVAQTICVQHYLQSRGGEDEPLDLPDNPMVGQISPARNTTVEAGTASIYGLYTKHSWFFDGVGCVPAAQRPDFGRKIPPLDKRVQAVVDAGGGIPQAVQPLHSPEDQAALQSAVDAAMKQPGARGVVVMKGGRLAAEGYAGGFDAFRPQAGWSMTKSLANVLAGRIEKEYPNFSIDRAISRPEWTDPQDPRAQITSDDLMRMTSGLEWEESYGTSGDTTQMLYRTQDMAKYVTDKKSEHPHGTYREYNTGSYNLLCSELQKQSGQGIDAAWKLLFKPLGMASAMLAPDATGTLSCGASAWATPRDWAKLGQFMANNGVVDPNKQDPQALYGAGPTAKKSLLPDNWVRNSTTEKAVQGVEPTSSGKTPPAYGAGWWLNRGADGALRWSDLPRDMFWADGHDGQYMVVIPSQNLVIVRQGFSPGADIESSGTIELVRKALDITRTPEQDDSGSGTGQESALAGTQASTLAGAQTGGYSGTLTGGQTGALAGASF